MRIRDSSIEDFCDGFAETNANFMILLRQKKSPVASEYCCLRVQIAPTRTLSRGYVRIHSSIMSFDPNTKFVTALLPSICTWTAENTPVGDLLYSENCWIWLMLLPPGLMHEEEVHNICTDKRGNQFVSVLFKQGSAV
jgi:hypothetical protein